MEVSHRIHGFVRAARGFSGFRQVKAGPSNAGLAQRTFSASAQRCEVKAAQPDTPAKENMVLDPPAVYVSSSHDPWFNLSYEDWLLRHTPASQPVLFLYRNIPCVVIGRNQNPWKETTPKYLESRGLPLVRRRSGGGTVYHDLGNTNFSILLPRELFTRSHGAELVARAIRESLGVTQCTVNDRNDVVVKTDNGNLKIRDQCWIVQHRAYHHGTMLISSSLDDLGQSLKSSSPNLETKGIASFRSAVSTLNAHRPLSSPPITHNDFVSAVRKEFQRVYGKDGKSITAIDVKEEDVKEPKIWKGVDELKSWDWKYGQSPEFTNVIEGDLSFGRVKAELLARHAVITSMTLSLVDHSYGAELDQDDLNDLAATLIGRNYATLEGEEAGLAGETEVVEWLKGAM